MVSTSRVLLPPDVNRHLKVMFSSALPCPSAAAIGHMPLTGCQFGLKHMEHPLLWT